MSTVTGNYSELVRRYFAQPAHAGRLQDRHPEGIEAEAAESATGARVVLSILVDNGMIRSLRYQVFGCPHLIAAAEAFCDDLEGQPVAALAEIDASKLMDRLAIPIEKTARLFILEDAARALHIKASGSVSK